MREKINKSPVEDALGSAGAPSHRVTLVIDGRTATVKRSRNTERINTKLGVDNTCEVGATRLVFEMNLAGDVGRGNAKLWFGFLATRTTSRLRLRTKDQELALSSEKSAVTAALHLIV